MPGIVFINYRRTDAGWAADDVAKKLKQTFGENRVFLDARSIHAGDRFDQEIEAALKNASVLLVLIGEGWLRAQDKYYRRRLDRDDDWVRTEIRTALRGGTTRVIPVVIDDAVLPEESEALPADIAELVAIQRVQIRQAHSDSDIEQLSSELERAGFLRLDEQRRATTVRGFTDEIVLDVVATLRELKQKQGGESVDRSSLLFELNRLFNRKTFRFESLRSCPEQRWIDRLDSAYQTEKALREWERNVAKVAQDKYRNYVELIKEVGSYCMHMGVQLFAPSVDAHRIKSHIGEPTFQAQLTPPIRFPVDSEKLPIIPDDINDPIERNRQRVVRLAEQLGVETSSG